MNYLKKTIDLLYLIFVREINFIIILFTLNFLPSCLYILLNEPGLKIMTLCTHAALYILFLSYIVAVLKCIFDSNIWKKVIAFTSLALSLFFFISESFLLYRYQSIINRYIIGTIIETNASEAKEYLLQYIDTNYLIILIAILFLFIISVRSFLHIKISLDYRYIKFLF